MQTLDEMTDQELEERRDTLAVDVRHEPALREELAELEDEIARRRSGRERREP